MGSDDAGQQAQPVRQQAMTAERLAEIHQLVDDVETARDRLTGIVLGDTQLRGDRPRAPMLVACHDLLAEVERQRELLDSLARQTRFEREERDRREAALVALAERIIHEQRSGGDGA